MADYGTVTIGINSGTDAAPTWTTTINFGGTSGANELRFSASTSSPAATTTTPSASWPYSTRPASGVAAIDQMWAFTADAVGVKCTTYDGSNTNQNVARINLSADGNFVSAPRISAFADSTRPTPSPGTQVSNPTNGANIINGQATDTSSTAYMKGDVYGSGITAAGAADVPPNSHAAAGTTLAATSGTAGSVATSAGAWLATWQSLQGWTQYITLGAIPKPSTAGAINFTLALFTGVNMLPGVMPFCPVVLDYTFA